MENNDKLEEQEFKDAVNSGYLLNKYCPEIAELLVSATGNSQWLEGLKKGRELSMEEEKSWLPDWLKEAPLSSDKNDFEPNADKDDIEPDR